MRYLILLLFVVTGCRAHGAGPSTVAGWEAFGPHSLAAYVAYPDHGERWRIDAGELVGRGPAIQAVLIRQEVWFEEGWVEATSSRADDGGLVLRYRSPGDYYLLAFRDDDAP